MRVVGRRVARAVGLQASGTALEEAARFSGGLADLTSIGVVPKGVYRFKTHAEANEHRSMWLARNMADLARRRGT